MIETRGRAGEPRRDRRDAGARRHLCRAERPGARARPRRRSRKAASRWWSRRSSGSGRPSVAAGKIAGIFCSGGAGAAQRVGGGVRPGHARQRRRAAARRGCRRRRDGARPGLTCCSAASPTISPAPATSPTRWRRRACAPACSSAHRRLRRRRLRRRRGRAEDPLDPRRRRGGAVAGGAATRCRRSAAGSICSNTARPSTRRAQGNIGPVAEALADALDARGVVVCPAFPGAGRTVYQGHLFVGDRLLSESGMERHPLTPMTDPDLRRVLARQSRASAGACAAGGGAPGAGRDRGGAGQHAAAA